MVDIELRDPDRVGVMGAVFERQRAARRALVGSGYGICGAMGARIREDAIDDVLEPGDLRRPEDWLST